MTYREDRSEVAYLQDLYDAAAHAVPARDAWTPDPMRVPDPADEAVGN